MRSHRKVAAYVLLIGATAAAGHLLMTTDPGTDGARFLALPQARLWILALTLQAGLWATVAPFLWRACREFGPATSRGWAAWLLLGVAAFAPLAAVPGSEVLGPAPAYPLAHHAARFQVLTGIGLVLLGPGVLTMWLIWHKLRSTSQNSVGWPAAGRLAGDLLRARERLAQVLLALGLAVGALTLATGALRSAVLAYRPQEAPQFLSFEPWVFGAGATVILAASYFPAYLALQRASRSLAEAEYPLDRNDRPDEGWYAERAGFIALLKLEIGPVQSFRTGVAILAPLAGSLLGILLPGK